MMLFCTKILVLNGKAIVSNATESIQHIDQKYGVTLAKLVVERTTFVYKTLSMRFDISAFNIKPYKRDSPFPFL